MKSSWDTSRHNRYLVFGIHYFYDNITFALQFPNHKLISLWVSCQIRTIAGAHAPGMPGMFSTPPRASDPDMHHSTCGTCLDACRDRYLTVSVEVGRGGKCSRHSGACATRNFTYLVTDHWLYGSVSQQIGFPHWANLITMLTDHRTGPSPIFHEQILLSSRIATITVCLITHEL